MSDLILKKTEEQALFLGTVLEDPEVLYSQQGAPYLKVHIGKTGLDPQTGLDLIEEEETVLFWDSDKIAWTERICSMPNLVGTKVLVMTNITRNDNGDATYWGCSISYYSRRGARFTFRTEEGKPKIRVFIGPTGGLYCKYDAEKGLGTVPMSQCLWNTETQKNYFCNYQIRISDKKDGSEKRGQKFVSDFKGAKGQSKMALVIIVGDDYVTDKQKDPEHPSVIYVSGAGYELLPDIPKHTAKTA